MAQMEGKVALVTGGNSGMGRATAMAFARNGAKVVVAARRVPEGEETVKMLAAQGGEAIFVRTDVAVESEVEAMVSRTVKAYGRLDYAFNNAGVEDTKKPLEEIKEEEFRRLIQVNLVGVWLCLKYELRQMQRQGHGAIVNCSSVAGISAGGTCAAYVS
ncbi:MAG: SDR family NAD(P)-dependent oxidoreductase, partial [Pseudomonadota bacterium]